MQADWLVTSSIFGQRFSPLLTPAMGQDAVDREVVSSPTASPSSRGFVFQKKGPDKLVPRLVYNTPESNPFVCLFVCLLVYLF